MRPVYLDNNATTRTDPAVVAAMLPFFSEQFAMRRRRMRLAARSPRP